MKTFQLPFGKTHCTLNVPDDRLQGVLVSGAHDYKPEADEGTLVDNALANPIGSPPACPN